MKKDHISLQIKEGNHRSEEDNDSIQVSKIHKSGFENKTQSKKDTSLPDINTIGTSKKVQFNPHLIEVMEHENESKEASFDIYNHEDITMDIKTSRGVTHDEDSARLNLQHSPAQLHSSLEQEETDKQNQKDEMSIGEEHVFGPSLSEKSSDRQLKSQESDKYWNEKQGRHIIEDIEGKSLQGEIMRIQGQINDGPDLILKSRSHKIQLSIKHMNKIGAKELHLLRNTVIFNFHGNVRTYQRNSIFCLNGDSYFRQRVIWLVEWRGFEIGILVVILCNSVVLTLYDYKDRDSLTFWNQTLDNLNDLFTIAYTIEALLKIIAQGFIMHQRAYIREPWNFVDFTVTICGLIDMSVSTSNKTLRTLRTIRVLRPLKSVNSIPAIKKHVDTLVNAMPNFANVAIFLIFVFCLFAILGLHQYGTGFFNRCRYNPEPEFPGESWEMVEGDTRACTQNGLGQHSCLEGNYCGNPFDYGIPLESEGVSENPNIFYGITTFNNIGSSLLLINQFTSTDNWSAFMYLLLDIDSPFFAVFYSLFVIIIGTFFIMNLILAVIIDTFVNLQERDLKKSFFHIPEIIVNDSEFHLENVDVRKKALLKLQTQRRMTRKQLEPFINSKTDAAISILEQTGQPLLKQESKQKSQISQSSCSIEEDEIQKSNMSSFNEAHRQQRYVEGRSRSSLYESSSSSSRKSPSNGGNQSIQHAEESLEIVAPEQFYSSTNSQKIDDDDIHPIEKLSAKIRQRIQQDQGMEILELHNFKNKQIMKLGLIRSLEREELEKVTHRYKLLVRADKNSLYFYAFVIINNYYFSTFINLIIISNTVIQSFDSYPALAYGAELDLISSYFSVIFIFEIILKLLGMGFKLFFSDASNFFDCVIVITSTIDLIVSNIVSNSNVSAVTALRTFRLLRIFKLAKTWKQFQQLLQTIWKTLIDISTFTIVLFLFMFIYTILGMEVFAYKALFKNEEVVDMVNGEPLNQNFDSFLWSFTTVFVLLTQDKWSDIFYKYYIAVSGWKATLFFISLEIIGPRMLLNIFLAILLKNFDEDSVELEMKKELGEEEINDLTYVEKLLLRLKHFLKNCFKQHRVKIHAVKQQNNGGESYSKYANRLLKNQDQKIAKIRSESFSISRGISMRMKKLEDPKFVEDLYIHGCSLNIFTENNKFRVALFDLVNHKCFENFIIFTILVSSVQLGLYSPLNDPNGELEYVMYWVDVATTLVFLIECIMKIITYGFVSNGQPSYLKNVWNIIDFTIIIFSVISISPIANSLKIFKMFRNLRVLRLISRSEGLRIGLQALFQAIPNVLRIVMIMVLFFMIFGIIAISFFKGRFYSCTIAEFITESIPTFEEDFDIQYKWDCLNAGGEWTKQYYTFDNMYQAIASLFIMANMFGWQDFMYTGAQVTDIDMVWRKWSHPYWVFFFIAFMIFGSFFLINLFVGVVISSFNRESDNIGGSSQLSHLQREWVEIHLLVLKSQPIQKPRRPKNKFGQFCYFLYESQRFENLIFLFIILNTFVLTLSWQGISPSTQMQINMINQVFTGIFGIEAIIKLTAMGTLYFFDRWNIFDLLILLISIGTILLDYVSSVSLGSSTTVIRAFRISKILRLIKRSKSLRYIFRTFMVSLKPAANIGSLLILILYMYAIMGVSIFGQVMRNDTLNDTLNFESFPTAALALFVVATVDGWTEIAKACLKPRAVDYDCITNPTYQAYVDNGYQTVGCGPHYSGILFFYSFFLIMSLILLKLFVAIILESYDSIKKQDRKLFNDEKLEKFNIDWQRFDPDATGFIHIYELRTLLQVLGSPLGFSEDLNEDQKGQDDFIRQMEIPTYKNFAFYSYTDILDSLALRLAVYDYVKRESQKASDAKYEKKILEDLSSSDEEQCDEEIIRDNKDDVEDNNLEHKLKQQMKSYIRKTKKELADLKSLEQKYQIERVKLILEINELHQSEKAHEIIIIKEIEQMLYFVSRHRNDEEHQCYHTSRHQIMAMEAFKQMRKFVQMRRKLKMGPRIPTVVSEIESSSSSSSEYSDPTPSETVISSSEESSKSEKKKIKEEVINIEEHKTPKNNITPKQISNTKGEELAKMVVSFHIKPDLEWRNFQINKEPQVQVKDTVPLHALEFMRRNRWSDLDKYSEKFIPENIEYNLWSDRKVRLNSAVTRRYENFNIKNKQRPITAKYRLRTPADNFKKITSTNEIHPRIIEAVEIPSQIMGNSDDEKPKLPLQQQWVSFSGQQKTTIHAASFSISRKY